jgi:outer membrane lipoprotein-sorting protein
MNRIAESAVSDRLDLWPEIQARLEAEANRRSADSKMRWSEVSLLSPRAIVISRRPILGLAIAALLAVTAGVAFSLWGHPEAVSAQEILDRAQATANAAPLAVTSYHLRMTRQVPGKGNDTLTTEVWFAGSTRQRSETIVKDGSGAIVGTNGVTFDGAQTWIHQVENGQTRVIHTVGTTWTKPVDDPSKQTSLADVLTQYGSDKQCMDARQQGEASVANRPTYVIVVSPKPSDCTRTPDVSRQVAVAKPTPNATAIAAKASAASRAAQSSRDNTIATMTVWVDEQTFLPLRTEVRNPAGVVLDESQVTDLQYNVAIPDSTFTYTPPAGVPVYNFTGGDGAQVKKAIFTGQATPQAK